jgi:lipoate-protein ligase A
MSAGEDRPPAATLPIGEYLEDDALCAATRQDRRPRHRVYRPARVEVVLGRGSKPELELELAACLADGVPVTRRRGGGCAVVLDPGDLIVSVALPLAGLGGNLHAFAQISAWLVTALAALGIPDVRREGASDLVRGERKVGGACIHRTRDLLYYATTLLCEPAVPLMERYLRHPPREPDYRRGRRHAEFVGSLLDEPSPGAPARLAAALAAELDRAGAPAL